jgi:MFS-type transporter involved in bile tolerance (Atg22 family)
MDTYSAEISDQPTVQSKFQSTFSLIMFGSMFLYMLEVLIPSAILHFDDIKTARYSILVTIVNSLPLFSLGWVYFFRDRPPASKLLNDQTILTAGFRKLASTFNEISSKYKAVERFLVFSIAWSEAGSAALPTVATTYMSEFLEMNSIQIGLVLLTTIIGGMPGALIGNYFCRLYQNPVRSVQICLVIFALNTLLAGTFLRVNTRNWMYGFAFVWGICQGWMHPQHTTIFVTIVPKENGAAELMGLYLFFCKILNFIPTLVFTILNELGLPMWVGISSLVIYFIAGLFGLIYMGDYQLARNLVL